MTVYIHVDADRRIVLHSEGGLDLEAKVKGIGWCLDNDAEVPDSVIEYYLSRAAKLTHRAAAKMINVPA